MFKLTRVLSFPAIQALDRNAGFIHAVVSVNPSGQMRTTFAFLRGAY